MFRTRMRGAIIDRAETVVAGTIPMERIGQPGELAPSVLFLASEGASYICPVFVFSPGTITGAGKLW
jgi:NAD(P)-dependent dehydrogenase (short-subunit alcohol dehydrogenase family)